MDYHKQDPPITAVETPEYLDAVKKLMGEEEREALLFFLATNPDAGDIIPGTGGVRKLRWALEGRGKRGGARVIYFFHNTDMPLFLLTAYAKNAKDNLSKSECALFRELTKMVVESYKRRSQQA